MKILLHFLILEVLSVLRVGRFHTFIFFIYSPLLILNISSFRWILHVVTFPTKLVSSDSEFVCSSYYSSGFSCIVLFPCPPVVPVRGR